MKLGYEEHIVENLHPFFKQQEENERTLTANQFASVTEACVTQKPEQSPRREHSEKNLQQLKVSLEMWNST